MAKPSLREFVSFPVTVPNISQWSVTRVRAALYEHEQGVFTNSAFLSDALERSPKTNAALNRRILTAVGLPFRLEAGTGDGRRDDAAVKKIQPHWAKIASRRTCGKLLRSAITNGVAFGELVWRVSGGQWVPRIKPWHTSFFHWDAVKRCYLAQTQGGLVEARPGDGNWVVFSYDEWDDQPWNRGVVRCLGIPDTIRSLAVRDWARYSEVHGIPMRLAEVPLEEGDEEEKKDFINQVSNPGNEITIVAPKGRDEQTSYKLSLIEAQDQAWEGFDRLIARMDGDSALAITGVEMVNESGVYNPKDNSEGVRQDYTEADAVALSTFLQEQVTTPWARFNLGEDAVESAPRPCYDATRPVDKKTTAEALNALGDGVTKLNKELRLAAKKQIDLEEYLEHFDLPLQDAPEDSLGPTPMEQAQQAADAAKAKAQQPGQPGQPGQPAQALSAAQPSANGLLAGQAYVDSVVDRATHAAPGALDATFSAVLSAVRESTGYEDLRARLAELAGRGSDDKAFRRLLAASIAMAQAAGVWSVEED